VTLPDRARDALLDFWYHGAPLDAAAVNDFLRKLQVFDRLPFGIWPQLLSPTKLPYLYCIIPDPKGEASVLEGDGSEKE
jgi:hypothetical protein